MCSEMLGLAKLVLQMVIDSDVHCNCVRQPIDPSENSQILENLPPQMPSRDMLLT